MSPTALVLLDLYARWRWAANTGSLDRTRLLNLIVEMEGEFPEAAREISSSYGNSAARPVAPAPREGER